MGRAENKTKEKIGIRHIWMLLVTVILLIAAFSGSIIACFSFLKRTARSYREEIVIKTSKLVAQQINGDKVDQWLATGTDDEYLQGTCYYEWSS